MCPGSVTKAYLSVTFSDRLQKDPHVACGTDLLPAEASALTALSHDAASLTKQVLERFIINSIIQGSQEATCIYEVKSGIVVASHLVLT